ncbi:hypothetical protein Leryth_021999 [Lithospermum erythrorhizon]|nr:hypothetical protein Leryth_021999 [Lithospermum erythrorhizon]
MSTSSNILSRTTSDLHLPINRRKHRDISPDRTVVWTEPQHNHRHKPCKKVPVVYYLSRNGHIQHPHFIEVPLSTPDGLHLQDVINRLNSLRGKGMASMYSWSSKRSYKSGYVWHDLAENDYIHPATGNEYVLKGSELLQDTVHSNSHDEIVDSSISKKSQPEHGGGEEEEVVPALVRRRRHQSWSSFDLHEYKVYQTEPTGESSLHRAASNASTQTDDKRRRRRANNVIIEDQNEGETTTELKKHEISPPPSDSSPETLETLMKADIRHHSKQHPPVNVDSTPPIGQPTGKSKATSVLMQLLSCGAMSFKDCGVGKGDRFSLISHYNRRLPRGMETGSNRMEKGPENVKVGTSKNEGRRRRGVVVEDKEYYSGSIVETKKSEFPNLRRSSSYNADR